MIKESLSVTQIKQPINQNKECIVPKDIRVVRVIQCSPYIHSLYSVTLLPSVYL